MSFNLISIIVLLIGLSGVLYILYRKLPVLLTLSEDAAVQGENKFLTALKEKAKNNNPFKDFSYNAFLQKMVSRVRILILKTDNKTFKLLQHLKKNGQEKKLEDDNYWDEVKKSTEKPR